MSTPSRAASICPPITFKRASDRPAPARAALLILVAALATGLAPQPAWADRAEHAEPAAVPLGGTVHVCIDAAGTREYRDIPCDAHQERLRAVKFVRAPTSSAQPARERERETASAAERRRAAALVRTARIAAARASTTASERARKTPDPCKAARARREDARERATSGLSFDQLRRLDREVWRLCPNG